MDVKFRSQFGTLLVKTKEGGPIFLKRPPFSHLLIRQWALVKTESKGDWGG